MAKWPMKIKFAGEQSIEDLAVEFIAACDEVERLRLRGEPRGPCDVSLDEIQRTSSARREALDRLRAAVHKLREVAP